MLIQYSHALWLAHVPFAIVRGSLVLLHLTELVLYLSH